jgi:ankyrin repeat protein
MSRYGEVAARTKHPLARKFLEDFGREIDSIDDILDKKDGLPLNQWNKQKADSIPEVRKRIEKAYDPEELKPEIEVLAVNEPKQFGLRLAHHAAEEGNLELLQELVIAGADLSLKCNSGHTPRDKAARRGHVHILSYIDGLG